MADNEDTTPDEAEATGKRPGKLVPLLMLLVGVGGGGAAGMMFVGPTFFGGPAEAAAEAPESEAPESASEADDSGAYGEGDGDADGEATDGDGVATELHTVANIIVNPRGTGTRFLLVDLSLKLSDPAAATELEARDVEIRDALLGLLGSRTVEQLTDIDLREDLKEDVRSSISAMLSSATVEAIYFPRFVIQ